MNPRGRTGVTNRGTLGKWGPNHAGDAIVTRYNLSLPHRPLRICGDQEARDGPLGDAGWDGRPRRDCYGDATKEFREEAANLPRSEQMRVNAVLTRCLRPRMEG